MTSPHSQWLGKAIVRMLSKLVLQQADYIFGQGVNTKSNNKEYQLVQS